MKKLNLAICCVLFSAAIANAGIFRESAKVVKPAVKTSAKAVKFSAKKTYRAGKASTKAAKKVVY